MINISEEMIFWWSIISTIIGFILLVINIRLFSASRTEARNKKNQVKIWQQDALGVSQGLKRIIGDAEGKRYSGIKDIASAIWALEASVFSLYQSLYEERVISEDEYKEGQKKLMEEIKKTRRIKKENNS